MVFQIFLNAPYTYNKEEIKQRLVNKLCILDAEKDGGKLYQGFC